MLIIFSYYFGKSPFSFQLIFKAVKYHFGISMVFDFGSKNLFDSENENLKICRFDYCFLEFLICLVSHLTF